MAFSPVGSLVLIILSQFRISRKLARYCTQLPRFQVLFSAQKGRLNAAAIHRSIFCTVTLSLQKNVINGSNTSSLSTVRLSSAFEQR
jgi:hypothetical protein